MQIDLETYILKQILVSLLLLVGKLNEPMVNSLQRLMDRSALGPCLDLFRNEPTASLAYLQDFVHMVYSSKSPEEHEVF